jgi:DNA polymerase III delta prime subunit
MVRNTISDFASSVSLEGKKKALILDEADHLTNIAQGALRGVIEEFPDTRFILTCNFKNKIIDPIHSRLSLVDFTIQKSETAELLKATLKRSIEILKKEEIEYDGKVVFELVKRYYPDIRKLLNDLQKYGTGGKIDIGILSQSANYDQLVSLIKNQEFGEARKWVAENPNIDPPTLFHTLYEKLYNEIDPKFVPQCVTLIAQYQYYSAMVADQEINTMALIADIMMSIQFKA